MSPSELTPISGAPKRKRSHSNYDHLIKFSSPGRPVVIISSRPMPSQPLLPKEEEEKGERREAELEEGSETGRDELPEENFVQTTPRIEQEKITTMLSCPTGQSATYDHVPLKASCSLPLPKEAPSQASKLSYYSSIPPEDDTYAIPDDPENESGARTSHIYSSIDEPIDQEAHSSDTPMGSFSNDNSKEYSYAATHALLSPPDGEEEYGTFAEEEIPHHYSLMSDDLYYIHHCRCTVEPFSHGGEEKEDDGSHRSRNSSMISSDQRASYLTILPQPRFSRSFSTPNLGSVALASSHSKEDHVTCGLCYNDLVHTVLCSGDHYYYNLPNVPQKYEKPRPYTNVYRRNTVPHMCEIPPSQTPPTHNPKLNQRSTPPRKLDNQSQPSSPHRNEPSVYTSLISREVVQRTHDYTHLGPSKHQLTPSRLHQHRANTTSRIYENQSELMRSMKFQRSWACSTSNKKYTPLVHRTMLDENDYALPLP